MSDSGPRTIVESLLSLATLLREWPDLSLWNFTEAICADANRDALLQIKTRVTLFDQPESSLILFAMMLVNISRFSPDYERILPLVMDARLKLDCRASKTF